MRIDKIMLHDFRNYSDLKVTELGDFNIIYGDNGQGKTNILEAMYLCAAGRSHRTSKDSELVRLGENAYRVHLKIKRSGQPAEIEIIYGSEHKKRIKINEIPVQKIGDLMGCLNAVIFSPEDLRIVKEGPSERRRFLDILISQLKPAYFFELQQYYRILEQRNNLLKEIFNNPSLADTLDIWDNNLIKVGSRIIKTRNMFLENLSDKAVSNHKKLTNGKEELILKYNPSIGYGHMDDIAVIENSFEKTIFKMKRQEAQKQTTLCGPQRDDYDITLNGSSIRLFGSQGQQRTAVLALKLSEIELMKEETGEYPVLLLDDVMSELDPSRQEYLFNSIKGIQTFITCTETELYRNWSPEGTEYFRVEKGNISSREA